MVTRGCQVPVGRPSCDSENHVRPASVLPWEPEGAQQLPCGRCGQQVYCGHWHRLHADAAHRTLTAHLVGADTWAVMISPFTRCGSVTSRNSWPRRSWYARMSWCGTAAPSEIGGSAVGTHGMAQVRPAACGVPLPRTAQRAARRNDPQPSDGLAVKPPCSISIVPVMVKGVQVFDFRFHRRSL